MVIHSKENDAHKEMCGIALCAGVGGLELGLHIAEPKYKTICYVEREAFSASTLVARMEDQTLDSAPIWDDLTTFDGTAWCGKVHIISAGYPCQPFSVAGKRKGTNDPRHLWPHVARIAKETDAEWIFCENVEGHINLGLDDVLNDLQAMGFTAKAGLFAAAEVGASHIRRRIFILAHSNSKPLLKSSRPILGEKGTALSIKNQSKRLANSSGQCCSQLVNDDNIGALAWRQTSKPNELPLFAPAPFELRTWQSILEKRMDLQPELFGLANGVANRMERSNAAGNGVVSLVAANAWRTLRATFD